MMFVILPRGLMQRDGASKWLMSGLEWAVSAYCKGNVGSDKVPGWKVGF